MMTKKAATPELLGILNDEARKGVGAGTVLSVLGPILDKQQEHLLSRLTAAAPELNELLDLRAKLGAVRMLKQELKQLAQSGHEASEKLAQI